jgi:hypothetical protein
LVDLHSKLFGADAELQMPAPDSTPSDITVVTDDRFLAAASRGLKAKTLGLKAFIVMLEKKEAKRLRKREEIDTARPFRESKHNMERLLKEFESRLANVINDKL